VSYVLAAVLMRLLSDPETAIHHANAPEMPREVVSPWVAIRIAKIVACPKAAYADGRDYLRAALRHFDPAVGSRVGFR